jgi:hypothetical protein
MDGGNDLSHHIQVACGHTALRIAGVNMDRGGAGIGGFDGLGRDIGRLEPVVDLF